MSHLLRLSLARLKSSGHFSFMTDGFLFQMFEILQKFVDVSMTKLSPKHGKVEELDKYYQVQPCSFCA